MKSPLRRVADRVVTALRHGWLPYVPTHRPERIRLYRPGHTVEICIDPDGRVARAN